MSTPPWLDQVMDLTSTPNSSEKSDTGAALAALADALGGELVSFRPGEAITIVVSREGVEEIHKGISTGVIADDIDNAAKEHGVPVSNIAVAIYETAPR